MTDRDPLKKNFSNPLLVASNFALEDSFGPQPALLVPSPQQPSVKPSPPSDTPSVVLGEANRSSPIATLPVAPPSLASTASLGPPQPGVFLLNNQRQSSPSVPPPPPSFTSPTQGLPPGGIRTKSPRYVPPPDFSPSSSSQIPTITPMMPPQTVAQASPVAPVSLNVADSNPYASPPSQQVYGDRLDGNQASVGGGHHAYVPEVAHHWFYRVTANNQEQWKPFTMIDSVAIEDVFLVNPEAADCIATEGGRYDVNVKERKKIPVYWTEEPYPVRRCSWFYKSNTDGRWFPYSEEFSRRLESEFVSAAETGRWNRRVSVDESPGEYVTLHSANVMMHFPSTNTANVGNLDDWGQVQPQNPELKPRVVHRGLDGLPEIPDGENPQVDHLVFMVHGIGSACDIRFRSINEVVDGFRSLTAELSERHFQAGHLSGKVSRIEFLPVNWHKPLHGDDEGTDERIRPLTLKSIPKLRNFVNDTLLDILFYTSPVYCQNIVNTTVSEINRMYTIFMARNEDFKGSVSVMGHSLGSLILFDILTNQTTETGDAMPRTEASGNGHSTEASLRPHLDDLDLEGVFAKLGISEHAKTFLDEGIDMEALLTCTEDDLKEAGLPLGPRKKLLMYLDKKKKSFGDGRLSGLEQFQKESVTEDVKYVVGPAGTGQPSVQYPRLCFQPACFYALGSPISMFLTVRGISCLGTNFKFSTCPRFFNIFHPFDPVAYRMESLIHPDFVKLRPVIVPHHKGRKRMHLELKDTVTKLMTTDFKQKIIDSVSATLSTVYNIATGTTQPQSEHNVEKVLEDSMSKEADEADIADQSNPRTLDSALNNGHRIDFVLQEAPLESFNEYLFALASHLCYWESEDTCLMVLKDIYGQANILTDDDIAAKGVPYFNASVNPPVLEPSGYGRVETDAAVSRPLVTDSFQATSMSTVGTESAQLGPSPTMFRPAVADKSPLGPPPLVTAHTSLPPPPPTASGNGLPHKGGHVSYPKPVGSFSGHSAVPQMGMDPTAPASLDKPLAPPPLGGFYKKPS